MQAPVDAAWPQGEAVVDAGGRVWLPFDLPHLAQPARRSVTWTRLSARRHVRHYQRGAFEWRAPDTDELHLLNGMGVTLGDSVIGINALAWLKARHPRLRIHLYRTPHAPPFVERLYAMASHLVDRVSYLPVAADSLPHDVIDLSDFLYWPVFHQEPMVDFFLRSLGIAPADVPASDKRNAWLARLRMPALPPAWQGRPYVLFCSRASTPLRSVPNAFLQAAVDRIREAYGLPVCGFQPIDHPHFHDVRERSRTLDEYLSWVRGAAAVVGVDSSGIHLAAGFDVPTLAFFSSIDPVLRVRDYPECRVVDMRCEAARGLHESGDAAVLGEVERAWAETLRHGDLPWPSIDGRNQPPA